MEEKSRRPKKRRGQKHRKEGICSLWSQKLSTRSGITLHTWKIFRAACAQVKAEDEDCLLEALRELPQKQAITDLQGKNDKLKEEIKRLKEELEDERKANAIAATKLSESLDLIRKMEGIVQQLAEVLNKARLFDEGLAKNPVTAAKVVPVLVDFNQTMEEILMDMRGLFKGLEVEGLVPLDQVPNLSINTEELSTLQGWELGTVGHTPTPTKPPTTPEPTPQTT